jgi:hypothetical protein
VEPRFLDDREPQRDRKRSRRGEGAYLERIVPAGELSHEKTKLVKKTMNDRLLR